MKKLGEYERLTILSKFIETFTNEEKVMQGHLIWNSLKEKPQRITFDQAINAGQGFITKPNHIIFRLGFYVIMKKTGFGGGEDEMGRSS